MQASFLAHELISPAMGRPLTKPRGSYGLHLASLREAAGLTQKALATRLRVHHSNIAFWERWDKPPRGDVLPALAEALGVSLEDLLRTTKPKPRKSAAKGKLQQVFEEASRLPRRQQQKVAEVVEALVTQHHTHAKAA